jgi:hypothetical protein
MPEPSAVGPRNSPGACAGTGCLGAGPRPGSGPQGWESPTPPSASWCTPTGSGSWPPTRSPQRRCWRCWPTTSGSWTSAGRSRRPGPRSASVASGRRSRSCSSSASTTTSWAPRGRTFWPTTTWPTAASGSWCRCGWRWGRPLCTGSGPSGASRMGRFAAAAGPRGRTNDLEVLAQRPTTRASVLAIPLVVPVGMRVLFPMLACRLGARRGYLAGFAVYWAGCYLVPLALLGRHRIVALLREPADPLPRPGWLAAAALLVPPLGAAGTELLPALGHADPVLAGTAGALAAVNATGEELLWRAHRPPASAQARRSAAGRTRPAGHPCVPTARSGSAGLRG